MVWRLDQNDPESLRFFAGQLLESAKYFELRAEDKYPPDKVARKLAAFQGAAAGYLFRAKEIEYDDKNK